MWRIRNWARHFEKHEASRRVGALKWVPIPTAHDGKGYRKIMSKPDGPAIYGTWVAILATAAKCDTRGVLADEDGPLSAEDIALKTGIPEPMVQKAIEVLIAVGWLEDATHPDVRETAQTCADSSQPEQARGSVRESPQTCCRSAADMQQTCGRSAADMQQTRAESRPTVHNNTLHNNTPPTPPGGAAPNGAGELEIPTHYDGGQVWCAWIKANKRRGRSKPVAVGKDTKAGAEIGRLLTPAQVEAVLDAYLRDNDPFLTRQSHPLSLLPGRINAYIRKTEKSEQELQRELAECQRELEANA